MTKMILNAEAIDKALDTMITKLCDGPDTGPWAVVGIRRGGEQLARRMAAGFTKRTGVAPALGMVDITLYRDDGFGPNEWPEVGPTRFPFDLKTHTVLLVDDVLYTGRTVRAAVDALLDYGRPKAIRLAVLVDRGLRELPIRPDAVGLVLSTTHDERVAVCMDEGEEAVVIDERGSTSS